MRRTVAMTGLISNILSVLGVVYCDTLLYTQAVAVGFLQVNGLFAIEAALTLVLLSSVGMILGATYVVHQDQHVH